MLCAHEEANGPKARTYDRHLETVQSKGHYGTGRGGCGPSLARCRCYHSPITGGSQDVKLKDGEDYPSNWHQIVLANQIVGRAYFPGVLLRVHRFLAFRPPGVPMFGDYSSFCMIVLRAEIFDTSVECTRIQHIYLSITVYVIAMINAHFCSPKEW